MNQPVATQSVYIWHKDFPTYEERMKRMRAGFNAWMHREIPLSLI